MILPTGVPRKSKRGSLDGINAFTFIELIIVMAMLTALLAVVTPTMSRFFRGQSMREEARKFLALTEYARSQAVSLAMPLKIWVNPQTGLYGMQAMTGFEIPDQRETLPFQLGDEYRFEFSTDVKKENGLINLVFQPDGSLGEQSPVTIQILLERQDSNKQDSILIARKEIGAGYRILDQGNEQILRAFR